MLGVIFLIPVCLLGVLGYEIYTSLSARQKQRLALAGYMACIAVGVVELCLSTFRLWEARLLYSELNLFDRTPIQQYQLYHTASLLFLALGAVFVLLGITGCWRHYRLRNRPGASRPGADVPEAASS